MLTANQNPEQLARDNIDAALQRSGWLIQNKSSINLRAAKGIGIREYQTDVSGADTTLTSFDKRLDRNFQDWIFKKQAGTTRYTTEQVQWLRMIKDYGSQLISCRQGRFRTRPFQQARRSRKNVAAIRRRNRCNY